MSGQARAGGGHKIYSPNNVPVLVYFIKIVILIFYIYVYGMHRVEVNFQISLHLKKGGGVEIG